MNRLSPYNRAFRLAVVLLAVMFAGGCEDSAQKQRQDTFAINKEYERGPATLTVRVSDKEISIADRLTLRLEVVADEDYEVELPKFGEKLQSFGIVDYATPQPKLIDGNRILTTRSYELEPFLSGQYSIPPMKVLFRKKGEDKAHEIESEAVAINVTSLLPEKQAELTIKDIAGPIALPADHGKWILTGVALTIVVVLLLGFAWWMRRRRGLAMVIQTVPAHELAYRELEALVAENLIEAGQIKQFYIRVSHIVRRYIENRFALRAPEQTTEEFLAEIQSGSALRTDHRSLLRDFLTHCDLVKFADAQPETAEIQQTFDSCKRFIGETESDEARVVVT